MERAFSDLRIEGEISDLRPAASGHIDFTLKDDSAQLSVVLFRSQARLLRFRPEDGLHILLRGRLSVYEQRGQMQIVAEHIEPMGAGSLQLAFEQVKRDSFSAKSSSLRTQAASAGVSTMRRHHHLAFGSGHPRLR